MNNSKNLTFYNICSWINRHHSSWLLSYLPAIALKAAAAEHDVDLSFSEPLQVLKSLLMSERVESGVLDERDSAGVSQDSF